MKNAVRLLSLAAIALAWSAQADTPKAAAPELKPAKVTATDARAAVFQRKSAVHENGADGPTTDVSLLKSRDGRFEAGLYSAGASDQPIEAYEEDEFMYFLEGGVKLTSADGTVLEVHAGGTGLDHPLAGEDDGALGGDDQVQGALVLGGSQAACPERGSGGTYRCTKGGSKGRGG